MNQVATLVNSKAKNKIKAKENQSYNMAKCNQKTEIKTNKKRKSQQHT